LVYDLSRQKRTFRTVRANIPSPVCVRSSVVIGVRVVRAKCGRTVRDRKEISNNDLSKLFEVCACRTRRDIGQKVQEASESGRTCRKSRKNLIEGAGGSLVVRLGCWMVTKAGAMLRSTGKGSSILRDSVRASHMSYTQQYRA